jgi:hypothetical protein
LKVKVLIGIVISAFFVVLAFREVNFQEMLDALTAANYLWLLPAFLFMLISHMLRAYRWRYFLEPIKPQVRFSPMFSALMIGYAANNIFPLRLGEFLRAYAIGKSQKISKSASFATIIVERLIDILALLLLLASTILFYPLPEIIKSSGYFIFAITVGAIVFMIFLMEKSEATIGLLEKFMPAQMFARIEKIVRSFLRGFEGLRSSQHYFKVTVFSILVWLLYAATVYTCFFAFDFPRDYQLNIPASLVVLVTVSIGIMIPSSPGFVGTYHWFCMQSLALYGVPHSKALSFAVISHALNTLPITIIGLLYFWKENLSLADADAVMQKESAEEALEASKVQDDRTSVESPPS